MLRWYACVTATLGALAASPARADAPVTTVLFAASGVAPAASTASETRRAAVEPAPSPSPASPAASVASPAPASPASSPTDGPPAARRRPEASCPRPALITRRMGDGDDSFHGPLLDCDRRPRPEALIALSVLARPRTQPAPSAEALAAFDRAARPGWVAEGVREVPGELLERVQRIADAFDGHRIEIVSGHRPDASPTSRHHHARAIDLRVDGASAEEVRDVLAGLDATGLGLYPRSEFVHVDVRERAHYWVDESGPGEAPRYVRGASPPAPPAVDIDALRRETEAALDAIRVELPEAEALRAR
ncbi:MAG: DUF882 domain-containing protein [Sandaracinaceae bacterium]|nr:DUF882 domain-containing protein [Sandaracinaceae bacterium]